MTYFITSLIRFGFLIIQPVQFILFLTPLLAIYLLPHLQIDDLNLLILISPHLPLSLHQSVASQQTTVLYSLWDTEAQLGSRQNYPRHKLEYFMDTHLFKGQYEIVLNSRLGLLLLERKTFFPSLSKSSVVDFLKLLCNRVYLQNIFLQLPMLVYFFSSIDSIQQFLAILFWS